MENWGLRLVSFGGAYVPAASAVFGWEIILFSRVPEATRDCFLVPLFIHYLGTLTQHWSAGLLLLILFFRKRAHAGNWEACAFEYINQLATLPANLTATSAWCVPPLESRSKKSEYNSTYLWEKHIYEKAAIAKERLCQ